jgi:GntR family transcriptional regulator
MIWRPRVAVNSPVPIFEQIIEGVRRAIALGRLRPGAQMPTVRELAAELLINPNTAAKAYQLMEQSGVLVTRRGAGTFVAEPNCKLTREERARILTLKLDECLTEAVHLRLSEDFVRDRFEKSMQRFDWPEEP